MTVIACWRCAIRNAHGRQKVQSDTSLIPTAAFSKRLHQNTICLHSFLVQQYTALQAHFLSGYKPQVVPPPPAHGFSGFGHATSEAAAVPAPDPVVVAQSEPIFSGFGHSTGQMGGGASLMGLAFVKPAAAPVVAAPAGPVFSEFGHATVQMGGNPSLVSVPV